MDKRTYRKLIVQEALQMYIEDMSIHRMLKFSKYMYGVEANILYLSDPTLQMMWLGWVIEN